MLNLAGGPGVGPQGESRLALAAFRLCRRLRVPLLLQASSAAVYGAGGAFPLREESPPRPPVSAYGRAKLAAERTLRTAWRSAGARRPRVLCLRIGNVAGADSLLCAARAARADRPLRLDRFADGASPLRSYVGPVTLARIVAGLSARGAGAGAGGGFGILNVAAPRPVTMDALLAAASRAGWTVPVEDRPAPADARPAVVLDTGRLARRVRLVRADSDADEILRQWLLSRGGAP